MSEEDIAVLKEQNKHLREIIEANAKVAEAWRMAFDSKLDSVADKFSKLPCDKRSYMGTQINALWITVSILITAIIGQWVILK